MIQFFLLFSFNVLKMFSSRDFLNDLIFLVNLKFEMIKEKIKYSKFEFQTYNIRSQKMSSNLWLAKI